MIPSRRWLPVLAVTAPVLVYFAPLVLMSQAPIDFAGDMASYFYPLTATGMAQWRAGHVPLWTSGVQTGFPLLADGQGALVYPLNLALYWLLPAPLANNLAIVLQTLASALWMYLLGRELKLPALPAVLAAWIWVGTGVFGAQSSPQLNAVTWWPLLVWLALRLGRGQNVWLYTALTGLVSGLMWLGGFPQMALYGVLLASAFLAYAVVANKAAVQPRRWALAMSDLQPVALWLTGLSLGIGLAAIQLLPTLEMADSSVRSGGLDYGLASQGSLFPTGLLGYLTSGWVVEGSLSGRVYIGIVALALALLRLRRGASWFDKFLWVVCGLTLLLAFGKYTPLYYVVSKLPGLSFLRVPVRFTMLTTFCLSLLAAQGLSQVGAVLSTPPTTPGPLRSLQVRLGVLIGILASISLIGGIVFQLYREALLALAKQVVQQTLLGTRFRLQGWEYYESKIGVLYTQITNGLSPANPRTMQAIAICSIAFAVIYYWRRPAVASRLQGSARWLSAFLLVFVGADLALFVGGPIARSSSTDLLSPPGFASPILAGSEASRTTTNRLFELVTQDDIMKGSHPSFALSPNFNLLFGVPHTGVYSALGSVRYFDLLGSLGGVNLAYGLPPSSPDHIRQNLHILDLVGARYIVASVPLDDVRLTALTSAAPYLYLNNGALPRAFFASKAVNASPAEALQLVRSASFDPKETVVLETDADVGLRSDRQATVAEIVEEGDSSLRIRATGQGWLVLTDLYYPGWRATIDGAETQIYRADAVFRAVAVAEPGEHLVTFRYEPDSLRYGVWLSSLSLFAIVGLLVWRIIVARLWLS